MFYYILIENCSETPTEVLSLLQYGAALPQKATNALRRFEKVQDTVWFRRLSSGTSLRYAPGIAPLRA
ncbi:MAG: hypothetical protein NVS1B11_24660 [Terriglobales bacterium]